jgi:DNA-binding CsgD family transcriptional regulator/tetratricopeptide (TPR) repeat protein
MAGNYPQTGDRLLERSQERVHIERFLDHVAAGEGRIEALEGPAGIGKTQLMVAAKSSARARGFRIGRAVGAALETEFSFGVVRQLFEPLLAEAEESGSGGRLFTGAASAAGTVLSGAPGAPAEAPGAVLHGLYWLTVGLARRGAPLLLICDDAHWFDGPSLRFLAYLAGRIDELPVGVLLAARPPGRGCEAGLLSRLLATPGVHRTRPEPLSDGAVAQLVERWMDDPPAPKFCAAVAEASRGNPFLVAELVRVARDCGLTPTAANAQRLSGVRANAAVMERIGALPEEDLAVARAVAVLGTDAHLRHIAALCGTDVDTAGRTADWLFRAEILDPARPVRFVHPLVGWAVYEDLPAGSRSALHRRAAAALAGEGAPAQRRARHLLLTEPAGDPDVAAVLLSAARSALAEGSTEIAIAQLRRALAEPPPADERLDILLALGTAESVVMDPHAIDHLDEAIALLPDADRRLAVGTTRAIALSLAGRPAEAVASLDLLGRTLPEELDLELLAAFAFVGTFSPSAAGLVADRAATLALRVPSPADGIPAGVLGVRAYVAASAREPAERVVEFARRALETLHSHDRLLPAWFNLPVAALLMLDLDGEAAAALEQHLTTARRSGAPVLVAVALFLRALIAFRSGDLNDASADAGASLDGCVEYGLSFVLPGPLGVLVDVLREQADLPGAAALLEAHPLQHGVGESIFDLFLLAARGRLRGAEGNFDQALADLELGRRLSEQCGGRSPNPMNWTAEIAFGMRLAGRPDAIVVARQSLREAQQFGGRRDLAEAQRACAMTGDRGTADSARAAVDAYRALGARLEEARTHLSYGTSPDVAGTPEQRRAYEECLRLAQRCAATRLAALARVRLRSIGARPKVRPVTGFGALTAGERRVVTLAAAGRSNKEIAQDLFVTVKTVETHLAHAYQKLQITSRRALAGVIG